MKSRYVLKAFVYFLSISFLLGVTGFHGMVSGANQNVPVGQMVSRGAVKFEIKENVWEKVVSPFPVFERMKIKTEKGEAILAPREKTRIEIGPDSLIYFDQADRLNLLQGKINFRMEPEFDLRFKVGNLLILKCYPLLTSRAPYVAPVKEEVIGSIYLHPKGSVTVKSTRGTLYITNQNQVILGSVSTGGAITIPSVITRSKSPTMVAKADNSGPTEHPGNLAGLSTWEWAALGVFAGYLVTLIAVAASEDEKLAPVCP
ncbi:MAG: hypothetical protein ACUVWO_16645 [Thermodesulfobacteriota bacterium]